MLCTQKVAWDVSHTAAHGVMVKLDGAVIEEKTAEGESVRNRGAVSSVPAAFVTVTGTSTRSVLGSVRFVQNNLINLSLVSPSM